jgi:hypothetical protein
VVVVGFLVVLASSILAAPTACAEEVQRTLHQFIPSGTMPPESAGTATAVAVIDAAAIATVQAMSTAAIADANRRTNEAEATAEVAEARLIALRQGSPEENRAAFRRFIVVLLAVCANVLLTMLYIYGYNPKFKGSTLWMDTYGKVLFTLFVVQIVLAMGYLFGVWDRDVPAPSTSPTTQDAVPGSPTGEASLPVRGNLPL